MQKELEVIRIGNSKGIRLPQNILKRYNIKDKLNLILEENIIILEPIVEPRRGWAEAFKEMHKNGDDKLLMPDVFEDEIFEEYEK